VPVGDHYRVGLRFACPSAVANRGRPLSDHDADLREFAGLLEQREGVGQQGGPEAVPPPPLQGRQRTDWPNLLRFVETLQQLLRNQNDHLERRLRKCLALANLCRAARFERVKGPRLTEFLNIVAIGLDTEVQADPAALPPPRWIGRMLFRQALALFTRKDRGPNRGPETFSRLRLVRSAWRFAHGRGEVPRLHAWSPVMSFERAEIPAGPLTPEAEQLLERYYLVKVGSVQFCGVINFGMGFWDGLELLLLTFPMVMWLRRGFVDLPAELALSRALSIVDDNFGYHPVLGTYRQQLSFRVLARTGELLRLMAWYAR
jgi:lysine-N-methylase